MAQEHVTAISLGRSSGWRSDLWYMAVMACLLRHIHFSACYLQLLPLVYCTDVYFFNDGLEFSWQQLWKSMAVIQVKLQATLRKVGSNLSQSTTSLIRGDRPGSLENVISTVQFLKGF